jgi:hypothetical protein
MANTNSGKKKKIKKVTKPVVAKKIKVAKSKAKQVAKVQSASNVDLEKRYHKMTQKLEDRLTKKNTQMMNYIKEKSLLKQELHEFKTRNKDVEFLLDQKEKELSQLYINQKQTCDVEMKRMSAENKDFAELVKTLEREISKKNVVIQLLQKTEYDYNSILGLEVENVRVKWVGWPEGGVFEEVNCSLINHGSESLKDLTLEMTVEDIDGNSFKVDKIPVNYNLKPKQKFNKKISLFKHLKKKGNYKLTLRAFKENYPKEVAEQSIVFTV